MGLGKKTGGRDFQPGQSGNPAGRVKLPPEIKEARKYNKLEVERILSDYMDKSPAEIDLALNRQDLPAIEIIVAKIVHQAMKRGDQFRFDFLLNRLIGKVKDQVEHSGRVTLESLVAGSNEEPQE